MTLDQAIFAVADAFLREQQQQAPDRHAELAPWFNFAAAAKANMLKGDARKHVDRTSA